MKKSKANEPDFIHIKGHEIEFEVNYIVESYSDTQFGVKIPAMDIVFSVDNRDKIEERVRVATFSFFDFWVIEKSWDDFFRKLNNLGFRIPFDHNNKMKKIYKNQLKSKRKINVMFRNKKEMEPVNLTNKPQVMKFNSSLQMEIAD